MKDDRSGVGLEGPRGPGTGTLSPVGVVRGPSLESAPLHTTAGGCPRTGWVAGGPGRALSAPHEAGSWSAASLSPDKPDENDEVAVL